MPELTFVGPIQLIAFWYICILVSLFRDYRGHNTLLHKDFAKPFSTNIHKFKT